MIPLGKYILPGFFCIMVIFAPQIVFGATYYFSSSTGDDSRSHIEAQHSNTPWRSIEKLNKIFTSLNPGDQVLFKRGEEFYGSININQSGTIDNPIVIGAYGEGEKPIISGFTTVNNWNSLGKNIWESTLKVSTLQTCNMVVFDGVNTPKGRYPNTQYVPYQTFSGTRSITSSYINSNSTNWTGAEAVIKKKHWIIDRHPITEHSGGTVTYSNGGKYSGQSNYGFFIQNHIQTLDAQNEWYFNPSTKKLIVYSTLQPTNVKVASQGTLVALHGQNLMFDGIAFEGANEYIIFNDWAATSSNILVQNCSFKYSGIDAVKLAATPYFTFRNNNVSDSNSSAINLFWQNPNATITNNIIRNTAMFPGMGENGDLNGNAIYMHGNNSVIKFNKIENTGHNGIYFTGDSILIKNNFVNNSCLIKDDGAGIYTYYDVGLVPESGRQIVGNIVLNSIGSREGVGDDITQAHGIYLDGNSVNVDVIDNTVASCTDFGIFINGSKNINIKGNTLFNNSIQLFYYEWLGSKINGITTKRNIFFSKESSQFSLSYFTWNNNIPTFGISDSNYFARPIDDSLAITLQPTGWDIPEFYQSISQWKTYSGQDGNSQDSPVARIDDSSIRLEYNDTAKPKKIALHDTYVDLDNNVISGTFTIDAFSSKILIKKADQIVSSEEYNQYVNMGSTDDVTWQSQQFKGERSFLGQFKGKTFTFTDFRSGTNLLFQTERFGKDVIIDVPVPNGVYTVKTYHNELWFGKNGPRARAGQRVYDIILQQKTVKEKFDLFIENKNQPMILTFTNVGVSDGVLKLRMLAYANNASISGLAIQRNTKETENSEGFVHEVTATSERMGLKLEADHSVDIENTGTTFDSDYIFEEHDRQDLNFSNPKATHEKVKIYPNPAHDILNVELKTEVRGDQIHIHNMNGQLMGRFDIKFLPLDKGRFTLPLDNIPQGTYLISILKNLKPLHKQRITIFK